MVVVVCTVEEKRRELRICCWWWLWPTDVVEEASAAVGVGGVGWCGGSERIEKRETGREGEGQNGGGNGVGDVAGEFLMNSTAVMEFGSGAGEKRREK
ncbi:hypothetical protein RHGRI_007534 [Rhododendron griersonianum]|uniref:Uncharacterized protein n=1 Tax=Rhododendron griersonianum TaxID=479676 RepID=A0AAV6KYL6_9ERIC|nr:hypothetical protein RHGRI_007534 [Rhododendron griersonianum]